MASRLAGLCVLACVMGVQAEESKKPSPVHYRSATTPTISKRRTTPEQVANPAGPANASDEEGIACYGADSPTLTASTPRYPIGSKVRVTNLATGKSVVVTVTEHWGIQGRIINVSKQAADQLGFVRAGTTKVRLARMKDQSVSSD
jgi:hypothetical protein